MTEGNNVSGANLSVDTTPLKRLENMRRQFRRKGNTKKRGDIRVVLENQEAQPGHQFQRRKDQIHHHLGKDQDPIKVSIKQS